MSPRVRCCGNDLNAVSSAVFGVFSDPPPTPLLPMRQSFTYADISVFAVTNAVATIYGAEIVSETAGKLWEFHNNVAKRARIAMHLSKRADTN